MRSGSAIFAFAVSFLTKARLISTLDKDHAVIFLHIVAFSLNYINLAPERRSDQIQKLCFLERVLFAIGKRFWEAVTQRRASQKL